MAVSVRRPGSIGEPHRRWLGRAELVSAGAEVRQELTLAGLQKLDVRHLARKRQAPTCGGGFWWNSAAEPSSFSRAPIFPTDRGPKTRTTSRARYRQL